ncbi:MAG: beta-ketoacyl-ACP synthase II [Waddliaceae bacterium]
MKHPRIVVTGMGIVSSLGHDVDEFYNNLLEGKSGIAEITEFPCDEMSTRIAGTIRDFDTEGYLDKKQARRVDKYISYAIVAGKKALEMGQLDETAFAKLNKERCGIVIGTGMGGMDTFANSVRTLIHRRPRKVSPFFVPYSITNMGGALLAMDLGFMGPNYSISTACATANNSFIAAANHIRLGDADLMICGGVEAAIIPMGVAGFCACKALSQRNDEPEKASRPWDRDRDGFVLGEGSGISILERLEHALERGAPILAEYLGHGLSCDAYHMTEPRPDGKGIARCIQNSLKDAGVQPENVDHINAHATSTLAGDMVEVLAMKQVFSKPSKIVMNATKSMIGHCLGAAAGIEGVATIKAIMDGVMHPTINLDNPEPGLDFRTPTTAEEHDINIAISNSFGFGGHNATVVFGKYRG